MTTCAGLPGHAAMFTHAWGQGNAMAAASTWAGQLSAATGMQVQVAPARG
jgi:hypothetical protein